MVSLIELNAAPIDRLEADRADEFGRTQLQIAYLISQYPKISHTFVRREILELERRGWVVHRFAIRGWDAELVDKDDLRERDRTNFVLNVGVRRLLLAVAQSFIGDPARFVKALRTAFRLSVRSDRSLAAHVAYFLEACWLVQELQQRKLSHVHAHFGTNPAAVAMLVGELSDITFSFTVHGPEEFDKASVIHLSEKIRAAAFVVAVSSFGRGQMFRLVDYSDWAKIKIVHCGIEDEFAVIGPIEPNPVGRLVCVGRLSEQKGQPILILALAKLAARNIMPDVVLVGDGEHRALIERLIAENGLQRTVRITGWADAQTVRQEMLNARALVLPSFAEGLPVVLMEAMSLGRPVVTTYVAGHPELVIDGENGWLCPAGSVDDLADAIERCLGASSAELQRMGENARQRVRARHHIGTEAKKLSEHFEKAIA